MHVDPTAEIRRRAVRSKLCAAVYPDGFSGGPPRVVRGEKADDRA
jgi:hypothetical protein